MNKKVKRMLKFGGNSYFQDVVCIKITVIFGIVTGLYIGSVLDFSSSRGWIDPNYYTPYRTLLNKFIMLLAPFIILLITIIFVICLIKSHAISMIGKVQRFLLIILFSSLLAILIGYGWMWIISFIAKIRDTFS